MSLVLSAHRYLASQLFYPCAAASALAVLLLAGRFWFTGSLDYRFFLWNLFLAWVPYLAALWANRHASARGWGLIRPFAAGALWLLFLPNAPYIMTDFVHLPGMAFVWWYDVGMLLAFAWSGCVLGVASLHLMRRLVEQRVGAAASWAFVLLATALCGFGIYLGRFLRWNSWDIFFSPRSLARELLHTLADPNTYPRLIGVTGLFAAFVLLGYLTLHAARRAEG